MNRIQEFLNQFLIAETHLLNQYCIPNLEAYNAAVDKIANFTTDEMKYAFGGKLISLRSEKAYERVRNYPDSIPRYIYRIDEYISQAGTPLFACYLSESSPDDDWFEYHTLVLVEEINDKLKIIARFAYSENDSGNYVYTLTGGGKSWVGKFVIETKYSKELIPDSFGKKINTLRLMAPESCKQSMLEYEKD